MCISNKEMDRAVEMAEADNQYALDHCADNDPNYVAGRYGFLHVQTGYPVPVRAGALLQPAGRLFPTPAPTQRRGKSGYNIRAAGFSGGIVTWLRDENSDEVAEYRIETDGGNAVEVTGRL